MYRLHKSIFGAGSRSGSQIRALSPAAWFRYGKGITVVTGVSQWTDQSGNARHLLQATGGNQPVLQADGSILFDGTSQFLKCGAFTLNQPETVYLLMKQVTWTSGDYVMDGNLVNTGAISQTIGTPSIRINAGSGAADNTNLAVNTYGAVAAVFNGASSALQINGTATITGNAGAANMGGFTLGCAGSSIVHANIQVKEAIVFAAAHDVTTRAVVIGYLNSL